MNRSPSIAIVGAGPSGLFSAQALLRAAPGASIDVIEALPVPFGLLRYGVAADHQGTKATIRQLERLFERDGVGFFGAVEIGRTIALSDLRADYDIVVLAAGLSGDRRLGIPGEDLAGVVASGRLTRWLNDHPDEGDPELAGPCAVVVGAGNVALDVARMLLKRGAEFDGSDFSPRKAALIAAAGVENVTILARGSAREVRFDSVLLKEFGRLADLSISVEGVRTEDADGDSGVLGTLLSLAQQRDGSRHLCFRFETVPVAFAGESRLGSLECTAPAGPITLPAQMAVTAIGFQSAATGALPRNLGDHMEIEAGLYRVGWYRHGPRGTIPTARLEGKEVARMASEALSGTAAPADGSKPGRAGLVRRLSANGTSWFDWRSCLRVFEKERALAAEGRVALKLPNRLDFFAVSGVDGSDASRSGPNP